MSKGVSTRDRGVGARRDQDLHAHLCEFIDRTTKDAHGIRKRTGAFALRAWAEELRRCREDDALATVIRARPRVRLDGVRNRRRRSDGETHRRDAASELEKLGAVIGVSNLHIYAAMRGQSLEEFQKTRNAPYTRSPGPTPRVCRGTKRPNE
jgi:hypothetical protein